MDAAVPSPRVRYWRDQRARGVPLLAAACATAEDALRCMPFAPDLILYHPSFTRPDEAGGSGMLAALAPLGNANRSAGEGFAGLPGLCAPCPVAMGVCGADPFLLRGPAFAAWREAGLEGIANFPTLGLVDGLLRSELEESGLGMAQEIACLREAGAAGFFTVAFACAPAAAAACAEAGCDVLIAHLGLTQEYMPHRLADRIDGWMEWVRAARGTPGEAPLILLHGDHLSGPADLEAWNSLLPRGCDGLFAGGGPERVRALRESVR